MFRRLVAISRLAASLIENRCITRWTYTLGPDTLLHEACIGRPFVVVYQWSLVDWRGRHKLNHGLDFPLAYGGKAIQLVKTSPLERRVSPVSLSIPAAREGAVSWGEYCERDQTRGCCNCRTMQPQTEVGQTCFFCLFFC